MANFTANDVKSLRQRTGVGMMDCKDALEKSNGDLERAVEILREKGVAKAAKKASREAKQGIVAAKVKGEKGVLLEVNSETDFVARNENFRSFVDEIAETILANSPKDVSELLECKVENKNLTVNEYVREKVSVLGENIKINRFVTMNGVLSTYVHMTNDNGAMVSFETDLKEESDFLEYGKNVAMHVVARCPDYLDSDDVPSEILEKEKDILKKQLADSKKPDNIIQKIVEGKMKKFYNDCCLLNQEYIKDDSLTVLKYTEEVAKKLGKKIKILNFARMKLGEGE